MSKQVQDAYIVAATRTPIGRSGRGCFRHTRPDDLLIAAIRHALAQVPSLDPKAIEDAVIGCSFPEAEQGINVARAAAVLAGLPHSVAGVTVNRFCASGLTALQMAADRIRVGEAEVMLAGGTESMSLVPMGGNKPSFNPEVFARDENLGIAYGMGMTAEKVAQQWKVGREAQDAFALQSHQRALKAIAAGEFADEMTPVEVIDRLPNLATGETTLKTRTVYIDEGPRPDTSLEGLAKLKPVFAARLDPAGKPTGFGSVTAGNSSQTSDGAGALILASEKAVKQFDLKPLARFVSFAARGVDPKLMGIGPIEAIPAALKLAGLGQDALDWIELNEAFAAQSLAVIDTLKLDPAKVNPMGGAIALGHPLGATGAIRAATVVHALRRHHLKYGMVTMCVGMGQGAAGILERV
ncbi:MAG TPA: acetyl-CoA C-acyltransferase [Rubrivivax sp.]|nr:acetyl-CoA C-acyltransferase [Rubrivivax sp.]